jgi:hypothetical protein
MALTKAKGLRTVPGAFTQQQLTLTGDTAYPTGGYVLTAADFGLTVLQRIVGGYFTTIAGAANELAVIPTYNADGITLASVAVALVVGSTGVQVANGANVSTTGIIIIGEGN